MPTERKPRAPALRPRPPADAVLVRAESGSQGPPSSGLRPERGLVRAVGVPVALLQRTPGPPPFTLIAGSPDGHRRTFLPGHWVRVLFGLPLGNGRRASGCAAGRQRLRDSIGKCAAALRKSTSLALDSVCGRIQTFMELLPCCSYSRVFLLASRPTVATGVEPGATLAPSSHRLPVAMVKVISARCVSLRIRSTRRRQPACYRRGSPPAISCLRSSATAPQPQSAIRRPGSRFEHPSATAAFDVRFPWCALGSIQEWTLRVARERLARPQRAQRPAPRLR